MTVSKLEKMEKRAAELRQKIKDERRRHIQKSKKQLDDNILSSVHAEYAAYPDFSRTEFLGELLALFTANSLGKDASIK